MATRRSSCLLFEEEEEEEDDDVEVEVEDSERECDRKCAQQGVGREAVGSRLEMAVVRSLLAERRDIDGWMDG